MSKSFATPALLTPRQERARQLGELKTMLKQLEETRQKKLDESAIVGERIGAEQIMNALVLAIARCKAGIAFLEKVS